MLIVRLGSHDMIISRKFFSDFRILIDVYNQPLCWPKEFAPNTLYSRTVATYTREDIRPQRIQRLYQQDAFRRDRAIARDDRRRRDGVQLRVLTHELVATLAEPSLDQGEVIDCEGLRAATKLNTARLINEDIMYTLSTLETAI
jgi:hypothetical protein